MPGKLHDDIAMWGELREGLHLSGYGFERACRRINELLYGNRWKLGGQFKTINKFLDSLCIDTLMASLEAKKRLAARIKELQPKASNRQIGKTLGIAHTTVHRASRKNGAPAPKKGTSGVKNGASAPLSGEPSADR